MTARCRTPRPCRTRIRGATGATGATGAAGATGATGEAGATGAGLLAPSGTGLVTVTDGVIDPVATSVSAPAAQLLADGTLPVTSVVGGSAPGDIIVFDGVTFRDTPSPWFSDGSDSSIVVSAPIILPRDMFYADVTLVTGGQIDTGGHRLLCHLLDLASADANAITAPISSGGTGGATATAGTGAVQRPIRSVQGSLPSVAGGAGGVAAGAGGVASSNTTLFGGGLQGAAGSGGAGSGGAGGAPGSIASIGIDHIQRYPSFDMPCGPNTSAVHMVGGRNSSGGGGGGGDGVAGGGGGGAAQGGGSIWIAAREIRRAAENPNVGLISARGGTGGNGGTPLAGSRGGGGAAGGGGGGSIYILTAGLLGSPHANTFDVSGGPGGNGGTGSGAGTNGTGGQAVFGGRVIMYNVVTGVFVVYDGTAVGGTAAVGQIGGASIPAMGSL